MVLKTEQVEKMIRLYDLHPILSDRFSALFLLPKKRWILFGRKFRTLISTHVTLSLGISIFKYRIKELHVHEHNEIQ